MTNSLEFSLESLEADKNGLSVVEVTYDLDEKLQEIGRRLLFADFQDELAARYPMLSELEIDEHYGLEWAEMVELLFKEIRRLRLSLRRGRMKSRQERATANVELIRESLLLDNSETAWANADEIDEDEDATWQ